MILKDLRDTSSNQYELMIVTIKHIAKLPEHDIYETFCGTSRDDELFRECDYYPVAKWETKKGLGDVAYLSVMVIHEESEGA